MAHQLCQDCGSNQFEHIDGRLYCVNCQSQNIALPIHVSFANEGSGQLGRRVRDQLQTTADETIPKIEIFEANETATYQLNATMTDDETVSRIGNLTVQDDNEQLAHHVWSSYEVYSYILRAQIQALIRLGVVENETGEAENLIECTFMIYLRYLSACGILDTKQQRPFLRQEIKRQKTNTTAKLIYTTRYERFAQRNTHVIEKKLCPLNLDILIGFIHCACTLINRPISIRQLIDWINRNEIPYYNIQNYLPKWMQHTGRDRFNLEKMTIHSTNFFVYYNDFIRPMMTSYFSQCIFESPTILYQILLHICRNYCTQIYFPFDDDTRPLFESICTMVVEVKLTGRLFLRTSIDLELAALSILIIIVLLRSINDRLLDEFMQNIFSDKQQSIFSYSTWLTNLTGLYQLERIRYFQFFGRSSILLGTITDNHSKIRYTKSLSKIFDRSVTFNQEETLKEILEEENRIRQILLDNSKSGSLSYAIRTEAFFSSEFQDSFSGSISSLFESLVNTRSPSHFSSVDKSELHETLLSLISGSTITQIQSFYLLHQRFDAASSSDFHLNNFIRTLTQFCSIPYNQDFFSFLSIFLKTFCFRERMSQYFYKPASFRRHRHQCDYREDIGTKQYGIDRLPIAYDLKFEQQQQPIRSSEK